MKLIATSLIILTVSFSWAKADTVIMSDNQELKGVLVEDYSDRVVLSTIDGEKEIFRKDIRNIIFDLEEQNLTSIGRYYQDKKIYDKAHYYYKKALDINPEYKPARDGLNYVGTYIRNSGTAMKLSHIQRLNESKIGKKGGIVREEKSTKSKIKEEIGITIDHKGSNYIISEVESFSPASKAGLRKGDILYQIWGRAIAYMEPDEVMTRLVSPVIQDVRLIIIRQYSFDLKNMERIRGSLIGAKLGFEEMEGLMIHEIYKDGLAGKYGIKEGDIVYSVQGQSVRYMDIKDVESLINSCEGKTLLLQVKREVVIWKKFQSKRLS